MDSLTHIALGGAIGMATMGRRAAPWKAALWGAVAATLPDLDVFIDHGDAIRNMVLHRAETHALFWLALLSLPLGAAAARLHGQWALWRRWWLAIGLALLSHPLLDAMTVYGTQLALPFSDHPYGVGSIFIIDPLYTLPLLVGAAWALATRASPRGLAANLCGLALSTAYLGWGVAAQHQVSRIALASLAAQGVAAERVLVTPSPFNSVLWRVVAVTGDEVHEGFYSFFDPTARMQFDRFDRGRALADELSGNEGVQRVRTFSQGFYKLHQDGARVLISDLRMGQEPAYIFSFAVAERHSAAVPLAAPQQLGARLDFRRGLPWLWRRMWGEPVAPPR
jgi:inner membrane protein